MTARIFFFLLISSWLSVIPAPAQTTSQSYSVESHGLNLHVKTFKPVNGNRIKHILLVHGLTYSSHEFHIDYKDYSLVNFLSENGFQIWTMDITGYGGSEKPEDGFMVNTAYAAEDIAAVVGYIREKEQIDQIDLLGWSWGTVASSHMVASHAPWIRKLILYAPITSGYDGEEPRQDWHHNTWAHAAADFQLKNGAIDYSIIEKPVASLFLANCWKYDQDASPNGGRKDLLKGSNEKLILAGSLKVPTLFIGGDRDPYLKWDEIESAYSQHPEKDKSLMIKIEGGAHALMMEKPYYRLFRNEVLLFLQKE